MLSTIFLSGLVIGLGVGRINIGPANQVAAANGGTNIPTNTVGTVNTAGSGTPTPQAALQPTPENTYDNIDKSVDAGGNYSLGNKNSKVKIEEYSDFQCPYCHAFFTGAYPQILKDYVATGKVYYTFHNFPLNIHPQAPKAAEAALCAGDQGKFWEYHDLLFGNQSMWSGNSNSDQIFQTLAQTLGLDTGKFSQCLSTGKYTETVQKDLTAGEKKEISGTPTLFINTQKVIGAQYYSTFKQTIDAELKK